MRKLFPSHAFRLAFVSCAVLAGGLVFMIASAPALAAEDTRPVIEPQSATNIGEHGATVNVKINPEGSETAYEIRLECEAKNVSELTGCNPELGGEQWLAGELRGGYGYETVSVALADLQPGYIYMYAIFATNAAGRTEDGANILQTSPAGACPHGCSSTPPYEAKVSQEEIESGNEAARRHAMEGQAEEQQQKVKEQEEQQAKEAALRAAQAEALKKREEQEAEAPATGSISLAGTNVSVQGDGLALVKLECLGIAGCHGKLTLAVPTKTAAGGKGNKRPARPIKIGTATFSIQAGKSAIIAFKLNAAGRSLLGAAHGHLNTSLTVIKSSPAPLQTHTDSVHLVRQKAHGKTGHPRT
jgi:hypothetical protein